jgi:hypothetical protein
MTYQYPCTSAVIKHMSNTHIELINEYGGHATSLFISQLLRCYMLRPQCVAIGIQTP